MFLFLQWLPQKWFPQVLYLLYRWAVMLYTLVWLAITITHATNSIRFKYLIFLTHWGFLAWNSYMVLSVITVTAAALKALCGGDVASYAKHDCLNPEKFSTSSKGSEGDAGCCKTKQDPSILPLEAAFKVQWALFLVGGEYAVVISILYWAFYTDPNSHHNLYSLDSLNLHMINGVLAVLELWLSGIPVRICHAVYSMAFGCVYVLFTGLYYAAGGRGEDGNKYIYPFLDYDSNAEAAIALAVGCVVFLVGGIHIVFFLQYKGRKCITSKIQVHYSTRTRSPSVSLKV